MSKVSLFGHRTLDIALTVLLFPVWLVVLLVVALGVGKSEFPRIGT